jgi:2'-5' RNA ligase
VNNQSIRTFIAIELPEELKSGIKQLQNNFKSAGYTGIKWVAPQGIHLTLKFLGNIQSGKIDEITKALETARQGINPFQLTTGELGTFPNLRRPRVLWLGLTGDLKSLFALQQRVEKVLIDLGFPKEDRPFAPHLTISRIRESTTREEQAEFGKLIEKTPFPKKYTFAVTGFNFMRSQLLPTGAVYSCLANITLNS